MMEFIKNNKMEMKHAQVFITLIILMASSITCRAETVPMIGSVGNCIRTCYFRCKNKPKPLVDQCVIGCGRACIPRTTVSSPSYYCNLGCSLDNCTKAANDANLLVRCLDDCSNIHCKA